VSLTVSDVVALPVVQAGDPEVLATAGMGHPVRWIHVSDVADLSNLLQGGELILTRGGPLRRAPHRYLERLARARAVGVIVEFGTEHVDIPMALRETAERLDLALIALHREIKFVEVTEQVHRKLVADQFDEVAFARRVHELFTDLSMRRADPTDIVEAAAELLESPVILEDLAHQVLAIATVGRSASTLLRDWARRSRRQAAGVLTDWEISAVGRGEERWARLIAIEPAAQRVRTTMVLERAAQALVIHRMAERGRFDIEHRAQADLVDDVLRHRIRSEDDVAARASALGLRPAGSYLAGVVRARQWRTDSDPVAAQRRNMQLRDVVVRAATSLGHTGLFSVRGPGEVAMVLSLRGGHRGDRDVLDVLAAALARDASSQDGVEGLVLGVSQPSVDLVEAIDQISEAAHIAEVAAGMPAGERLCFRLSDIRLRGLLSSLRDDPRVQRFAESELRKLILHDLENGDNLQEILRGYFELGRHKSALAIRLHMSRPALYAKLARIEKMLGVDLSDGESATSLHVAILILDARREATSVR
jgi:purine catabolism regulator